MSKELRFQYIKEYGYRKFNKFNENKYVLWLENRIISNKDNACEKVQKLIERYEGQIKELSDFIEKPNPEEIAFFTAQIGAGYSKDFLVYLINLQRILRNY
jgi:hypothetical protein